MIIAFSMYGILFDLIQDRTLFGFRLNHRFVLLFLLGLVIGAIAVYVIQAKRELEVGNPIRYDHQPGCSAPPGLPDHLLPVIQFRCASTCGGGQFHPTNNLNAG